MYLLILIFPLLSFCSLALFGNYIGIFGSGLLCLIYIGLTLSLSFVIFYEVILSGETVNIKVGDWFSVGSFENFWGFLFDPITSVMLLVILSISFCVHLYSLSYMKGDPHIIRFLSYLSLFTFFMLCLVTSDNYIQLFFGWEGVGISSYLLVNFWYTRIQANKSALKAIIVNRIGDIGLIIALSLLFLLFKTFDFSLIFLLVNSLNQYYFSFYTYEIHGVTLIVFFLFIGTIGKSAQLGLHTWLPDAMEGPTPVSALIHAATMVTAGVFLLIRSSYILESSYQMLIFITIVGSITALFAGTIGVFQNDLKRIIAYSTCSQLGYMVFACGLSSYSVAFFHLMNHAFFKALLFLSAGSVIHALGDEQDIRRMGGLIKLLPFTYVMFVIGSLALLGFPFTTGFYSKDVILELAYSGYYVDSLVAYWLGVLGACLTAYYSFRLLYFVFITETNTSKNIIKTVHEGSFEIVISLFLLSIGSIFVGYLFKDLFIGLGTSMWQGSLNSITVLGEINFLEAEFLISAVKLLPVFLSILFSILAYLLYYYYSEIFYFNSLKKDQSLLRTIYLFFNKRWLFDIIYNYFLVFKGLKFGYLKTFKLLDRGVIELYGPTGLVRSFLKIGTFSKSIQSGYIFNYVFFMVLSVLCILLFNYTFVLTDSLLLFFLSMFSCLILKKKK